jgi:hypothetical protein
VELFLLFSIYLILLSKSAGSDAIGLYIEAKFAAYSAYGNLDNSKFAVPKPNQPREQLFLS